VTADPRIGRRLAAREHGRALAHAHEAVTGEQPIIPPQPVEPQPAEEPEEPQR
jgi:hypothetical protein